MFDVVRELISFPNMSWHVPPTLGINKTAKNGELAVLYRCIRSGSICIRKSLSTPIVKWNHTHEHFMWLNHFWKLKTIDKRDFCIFMIFLLYWNIKRDFSQSNANKLMKYVKLGYNSCKADWNFANRTWAGFGYWFQRLWTLWRKTTSTRSPCNQFSF